MIKKTIKEIGNSIVLTLTKDVTLGKKIKKGSDCIVSSKLKKDHIVVTAKIYFDLSEEKNRIDF